MKYVSIDIETTGLDRENDQIVSIGLAIEDTNNIVPVDKLPQLYIIVLHDRLAGSPHALTMNYGVIMAISSYLEYPDTRSSHEQAHKAFFLREDEVCEKIFKFLWDNDMRPDLKPGAMMITDMETGKQYPKLSSNIPFTYLNVAGKNFASFDKIFLEKLPRWKQLFRVRSRILDPGILFVNWKTDDQVPGLSECKQRAGLDSHVSHNALEDAIAVISLLRIKYHEQDR